MGVRDLTKIVTQNPLRFFADITLLVLSTIVYTVASMHMIGIHAFTIWLISLMLYPLFLPKYKIDDKEIGMEHVGYFYYKFRG